MVEQVDQLGRVVLSIVPAQAVDEVCRQIPAGGVGETVKVCVGGTTTKCGRHFRCTVLQYPVDDVPCGSNLHMSIFADRIRGRGRGLLWDGAAMTFTP